jgi:hypothetical protein
MVVGAIIQTATYGAPQLIVGRLISGVGNGRYPSLHLHTKVFKVGSE